MRATIVDIAKEAGVSTATVDRVLNGRAGVTARTRTLVAATAARLGYGQGPEEAGRVRAGRARAGRGAVFDILLPGGTNTFMNLLAAAFDALAHGSGPPPGTAAGATLRVRRIEGFDPGALARAIEALRGRSDGLAVVALDHPTVREAIRLAAGDGVPVVTLCSDISNVPRRAYVGIDNRAAGRLAGWLVGRFSGRRTGKVALLAGSLSYRGHEEREMGFRHMLQEGFGGLEIVALREGQDDFDRSYAETRALLAAHPDLCGLYNIGAGNRGVARALAESGRAAEIVFVGHELTEHTRRFLVEGTMDAVIDQAPAQEAAATLAHLLAAVTGTAPPIPRPDPIQVIFRENLPEA